MAVHLTVEMLSSGRMISRTDAVALPLAWPLDGGYSMMLVVEAWTFVWALLRMKAELRQAYTKRRSYFDIGEDGVWNIIDLIGYVMVALWMIVRAWWWAALGLWHGLDPTTSEYIGWFQPLSRLMFVQRAFAGFAVIFSWMGE